MRSLKADRREFSAKLFLRAVLQSAIFFETPEEIFTRVFTELKPRTAVPAVRLKFCKFANANSSVRWDAQK